MLFTSLACMFKPHFLTQTGKCLLPQSQYPYYLPIYFRRVCIYYIRKVYVKCTNIHNCIWVWVNIFNCTYVLYCIALHYHPRNASCHVHTFRCIAYCIYISISSRYQFVVCKTVYIGNVGIETIVILIYLVFAVVHRIELLSNET